MPATSEKQRRFMALVHAAQTGKAKKKDVGSKVTEVAKGMSKKQSKDFMHMEKKAQQPIVPQAQPQTKPVQIYGQTVDQDMARKALVGGGGIIGSTQIMSNPKLRNALTMPLYSSSIGRMGAEGSPVTTPAAKTVGQLEGRTNITTPRLQVDNTPSNISSPQRKFDPGAYLGGYMRK